MVWIDLYLTFKYLSKFLCSAFFSLWPVVNGIYQCLVIVSNFLSKFSILCQEILNIGSLVLQTFLENLSNLFGYKKIVHPYKLFTNTWDLIESTTRNFDHHYIYVYVSWSALLISGPHWWMEHWIIFLQVFFIWLSITDKILLHCTAIRPMYCTTLLK